MLFIQCARPVEEACVGKEVAYGEAEPSEGHASL